MTRLRAAVPVVLAGALVVVVSGAGLASASAPRAIRLAGARSFVPSTARALGRVAGSSELQLTVALKSSNAVALENFASAVASPGNPDFHHYLSVSQFARLFGAPRASQLAVLASLRAVGLDPESVSPNALSISLQAPAAAIERAFGISLERYEVPASVSQPGVVGYAATAAPQLAAAIVPDVQAVIGLDSLTAPQPAGFERAVRRGAGARESDAVSHPATAGPHPCGSVAHTINDYGGGWSATQMADAYDFNGLYSQGDLGAGQTIALYELERNTTSDIAAFQQCYGTHTSVSYVKVDGGATGDADGSGEAAMDIEDALSLAPDAKIIVYQGPNDNSGSGAYDTFNKIISSDSAQVVSSSWGVCEPDLGQTGSYAADAESLLFEEAATQGQTILAAAGDNGSAGCYADNTDPRIVQLENAVSDPASQPFVTGVGGTSLAVIGPSPSYTPTETTWNSWGAATPISDVAEQGAGGGGVSVFWPMPSWQSGARAGLNVINGKSGDPGAPNDPGADFPADSGCAATDCREVPDVSAEADPANGYVIYWNGDNEAGSDAPIGWQIDGGTSASTPLWAALIALVNASPACKASNVSAVGFVNPALYQAADDSYGSDFNDITTGNNGNFDAGTGYDMATGLGSPVGAALASSLCADSPYVANPGTQTYTEGTEITPLTISSGGPYPLTVKAKGLPAGLTFSAGTGTISGTPTTAGFFKVAISASDSLGTSASDNQAAQARFTIDVVSTSPPRVSASLKVPHGRHPKLVYTVTAPAGTTLRTATLHLPASVSLGGSNAQFNRDISVHTTGGRWIGRTWVKHTLTLTFSGTSSATVTMLAPSLRLTAALSKAIGNSHGRTLTFASNVLDSASPGLARPSFRLISAIRVG